MTDENENEQETDSRRRDPELLAMERIVRILDSIEDQARARMVAWLSARYKGGTP